MQYILKFIKNLINSRLHLILFTIFCFLDVVINNILIAAESQDQNNYVTIHNREKKHILNDFKLPKHKPIPGGIAIIPLDLNLISPPKVLFNGKRILVIKYTNSSNDQHVIGSNDWVAILGIPMETKPGLHKISIFLNKLEDGSFEEQIEKSFLVTMPKYPIEKLQLSKKFVDPSYTEQLRINQEQQLIKKAYEYRSALIPNLTLFKPVNGKKTSPFGLKRILNGKHKGFHSGLDLAAPIGTKVTAASYGRVILIGDFFYTGYSVFVDHGHNLITSYSHLESISVKEGDLVNNETVIGTVGTTGRSTGPHLHWAVSLNNVRVNPELFLE